MNLISPESFLFNNPKLVRATLTGLLYGVAVGSITAATSIWGEVQARKGVETVYNNLTDSYQTRQGVLVREIANRKAQVHAEHGTFPDYATSELEARWKHTTSKLRGAGELRLKVMEQIRRTAFGRVASNALAAGGSAFALAATINYNSP